MTDDRQRVLVTAGASGIGLAIARAFHATGAIVHICDIDATALTLASRELSSAIVTLCDVADAADVRRALARQAEAGEALDVLVNNAGIAGPTLPLEQISDEDWSRVLDVNLTGTFNVTKAAIPLLRRASHASIIVISSFAGRIGYRNRSPYCASKWGLIGLTKTLSQELGADGIRVNAILPGAVEGPRLERVFENRARLSGTPVREVVQSALVHQSLKHFAAAHEIGELAVFLASAKARSISGQALSIDGDAQIPG